MRTELKLLRVSKHLTQEQMAERVGKSREVYRKIENGITQGDVAFWAAVQNAFDIPDEQMYKLMKCD